ncbi:uncharacterized protein DNG_02340 [Cephalotrichum gorgonifer]|uniref:ABM domain-containing protein n=1 Tax=Cephalotrichum gorgonifer TaxID=2041049 RepID=A0AAE8ST62_9PEZI|nr:uncharacterized protein DNG_02340 [Cephalotrichum gorgonifer]
MASTEVTVLQLKPGSTASDSLVHNQLERLRGLLEPQGDSQRIFYWYQQTEDPSYIYIIRECGPSSSEEGCITTLVSRETLSEILGTHFELSRTHTYHVDLPTGAIPADAPLISIGHHKVPWENKELFEKKFANTRHLMDEYVTRERKGAGGWRIDRVDESQGVFVLFVGWESWEQHFNFVKTEVFVEYRKILQLLSGYESRHAKLIEIG